MKLSGFREVVDYFSSKASDINRQLTFAGIAIIWIFKKETGQIIDLPNFLYRPLIFFVLALIFDLFQYIIGFIIWKVFHRSQEKKGRKDDDDVLANPIYSYPIDFFFLLKIIATAIAYGFLLVFLFTAIQ